MERGTEDNHLKSSNASDGFGGLRNQSFSNFLLYGFFGVQSPPLSDSSTCHSSSSSSSSSSANDLSLNREPFSDYGEIREKGHDLETIVSPSDNEDGRVFDLRRNRAWASTLLWETGLRQASLPPAAENIRRNRHRSSPEQPSATTVPSPRPPAAPGVVVRDRDITTTFTENLGSRGPKVASPQPYPHLLLEAFFAHDVPRNDRTIVDSAAVDRGPTTTVPASTHDATTLSSSLRDLLWNFNHEKVRVTRKEMNMMTSIDQ